MACGAILELGPYLLPQCDPEVTQELRVTVGDYGSGDPMESHHFLEVQLSYSRGIIGFGTRDEVCHL